MITCTVQAYSLCLLLQNVKKMKTKSTLVYTIIVLFLYLTIVFNDNNFDYLTLEDGTDKCPETPETYCRPTLCNIPEEGGSHLHCGESLISRIV